MVHSGMASASTSAKQQGLPGRPMYGKLCSRRRHGAIACHQLRSGRIIAMGFKYTFLSKWTVLILTLVALGLTFGGYQVAFGPGQHNTALVIVGITVGLLFYVFGCVIALLASLQ